MPVPRHQDEDPPTDRPSIKLLTDDPGCPVLLKCDRSAVLSVHVLGHSKPSVRWFIGQRMVRDCPRYGLSTDGHKLYALVIRQVTEELECGVLVTVSSDKGVSSKLIDVKTYRVFSRTDHKPDMRTGTIGSLRRRRQARGQLMTYPVRGRQSLGSLSGLGPSSVQGLTVKKAYSSTDAILKKGRTTPEIADSSSLPDKRRIASSTIRVRSTARAVEVRRLKKAFSWVENLVPELPTPPITPGVWEGGRPVYLSQDCLLTPSTPVRVSSPPIGYSIDRPSSARNRSSTESDDLDNEVLWQMYGFKLGRERPLPGLEEQSEEPQRDPNPVEKQKERPQNGRPSKKTNSQQNFIAEGPLKTVHLEKLNRGEKARSVPGLELMARGSKPGSKKQLSDPRYLLLKTNARTVCCENPVIADIRRPNDYEKRFSLPQDFYAEPFKLKPETEGNQIVVYKSYEGINHPEPGSLQVKTFNRTQSPHRVDTHKPNSTTASVWRSQTHCGNQAPVSKLHQAIAKSCDEFSVGQPSRISEHEQEINKRQQQQPKQQHSASYKRKAFSATVNLRKKNATGSSKEGDRITKFILVDIDFDNRSGKPVDSEGKPARDTNSPRAEWHNGERGRSRETGDVHQDQRRLVARSRSADSSYLYEKMYKNG